MGGKATLESYGIRPDSADNLAAFLPRDHLLFFEQLLPYWEDETHIYVHAGLQPGVHLTQQSPEWLFWSREKFIDTPYNFGKIVVYGHTPYEHPRVEMNKIGIDTGAVYGNSLTCLVLPQKRFISLQSQK